MNKTEIKWRGLLLLPVILLLLLIPVLAQAGTPQTITFNPPVTMDYHDSRMLDLSTVATGGGSSAPLLFTVLSGNATISGTTLTLNGAGQVVVQASQAGDATYDAAPDVWKLIQVTPQMTVNSDNSTYISNHIVAIKSDNTVWGWDAGGYACALGNNASCLAGAPEYYPVQALQETGSAGAAPIKLSNVASGAAGGSTYTDGFSITLKKDGTVWGYGSNNYGQLGDGSATVRRTATQMMADANSTPFSGVIAVAAGMYHTLLLKNDGTVWAVGYNSNGQLGNNTTVNSTFPVKTIGLDNVIAVSAGLNFNLALKRDGTVWAWGYNSYGQLGDGTVIQRTVPVQMKDGAGFLQGVKAISAGNSHSMILKQDGTIWSVGYNGYGQLGDNTVFDNKAWVQAKNISNVTAIAAGKGYSVALTADGKVWAWGYNIYGQTGNGDNTTDPHLPLQVTVITNIINISAGPTACYTGAIKDDGTVWSWGRGGMGNGTANSVNSLPVQVLGYPFWATYTTSYGGSLTGTTTQLFNPQFNMFTLPPSAVIPPFNTTAVSAVVSNSNYYWGNWTGTDGYLADPLSTTIPPLSINGNLSFNANFFLKTAQIISFDPPTNMTYGDADIDLNSYLTGQGTSGNPVTFNIYGPATLLADGHTLHITGTGTIGITPKQAGSTTYLAATGVTRTIVVAKAIASITLSNLVFTYDGTQKAVTATTNPPGRPVTVTYNGVATVPTKAGTYFVSAFIASSDALYQSSGPVSDIMIINQAIPVLSWATPADMNLGQSLTSTQLNATAKIGVTTIPGIFVYNPPLGSIPAFGVNRVTATFNPTDNIDYVDGLTIQVNINVKDAAAPTITSFSIPLNSANLSVPVTFSALDNVAVTGYLLSETSTIPAIGDARWVTPPPGIYTFSSAGAKTLYAFAKDAAGNISVMASAATNITLPDTTPPTVATFVMPATASSLTVPVTTLITTDNIAVIGWFLSESPSQPMANDPGWSITKPAQFIFSAQGPRALYAFAKDAAGNVSAPQMQITNIILPDTKAPLAESFLIPANSATLTIPVYELIINDNVGVTGYLLSETATRPLLTDPRWSVEQPQSYTFASQGFKLLYAFAKDAAGNISVPIAANLQVTLADTTAPVVTAFATAAVSSSLTVAINQLTATDDVAVTGYFISESAAWPSAVDPLWSDNPPAAHTFSSQGVKTLYAFAKDAAGNISIPKSFSTTISLPDKILPVVNSFEIPPTLISLIAPITSLVITDNVGVTAYFLSEVGTKPDAADLNWKTDKPTSWTFSSQGTKTLYVFGMDAAGNISDPLAATTVITLADKTAPVVSEFTLPTASTVLTVPINSLVVSDNVGVTEYLLTETATVWPADNDPRWSQTKPSYYPFTTQGVKVLYAFGKDAAGNISAPLMASTTIILSDNTPPYGAEFIIPPTSAVLNVPITSLIFFDDVGVTDWLLNESGTYPQASDPAWSAVKPQEYLFGTIGWKTLFAFAKDSAGNISPPLSAKVVISAADTKAPVVDAFIIPPSSTNLTVPIIALVISDDNDVTGYIVSESSTAPAANDARWQPTKPQQYTFTTDGLKTLYAFGKDAAGNVSAGVAANTIIDTAVPQTDKIAPLVSVFVLPATSTALTVPVLDLVITDNIGVTGYLLSESYLQPSPNDLGWSAVKPAQYSFTTSGTKVLYAFGKDAAGNVSTPMAQSVVINNNPLPKPVTWSITPDNTAGAIMLYNGNPFVTALTVDDGDSPIFNISATAGYGLYSASGCGGVLSNGNFMTAKINGSCTITPTVVKRNANGGNGVDPTIADAMKALQAYTGAVKLNDRDKIRYDVAPLDANSIPQGNGVVDIADVILTLRRIVGIGNW